MINAKVLWIINVQVDSLWEFDQGEFWAKAYLYCGGVSQRKTPNI